MLDKPDRHENTALHVAAMYGHVRAACALIDIGFRVAALDKECDRCSV